MNIFNLLALAALTLTIGTSAALAADTMAKGTTAKDGMTKDAMAPKHGDKMDMMWSKMDINKDGMISKEEATAFHDAKFMEMDANKDGNVSRDEMKAFHEAHKAEWSGKKDGMKSTKMEKSTTTTTTK